MQCSTTVKLASWDGGTDDLTAFLMLLDLHVIGNGMHDQSNCQWNYLRL